MIVAVPKERVPGEKRVALVPDSVKRLTGAKLTVRVERDAGLAAGYPDDAFRSAGAEIVDDGAQLWSGADVMVTVQPPGRDEVERMTEGAVLIGVLRPQTNRPLVEMLVRRRVIAFSLDALPRITRAQSMDVLSSMSTVAGYKAVLLAAGASGRFFPMLTTAAGTIPPARVLVLGAGVAGLQAIATARRLGAVVQAFDVRPAVKEQVESLGATFLAVDPGDLAAEGAGGYAAELSVEQHRRELELIGKHLGMVDVVISTALIPGRRAPILITDAMVRAMRPGAVIVDLAADAGGNCEVTKAGQQIEVHGVHVLGPLNLAATMPTHASQMFSRNLTTFLQHIIKDGALKLDDTDEITAGTCITRDGTIVHEATRQAFGGGGS